MFISSLLIGCSSSEYVSTAEKPYIQKQVASEHALKIRKVQGHGMFQHSEGKGTYTWENGIKYVGSWRRGYMNGLGILYRKDGSIIKDGYFRNVDITDINAYIKDIEEEPIKMRRIKMRSKIERENRRQEILANTRKWEKEKLLKEEERKRKVKEQEEIYKEPFRLAIKECEDLGFEKETESFGQCVLDLTEQY